MAAKGRSSKEQDALLESTRQALSGLGVTSPKAVEAIMAETLGLPASKPEETSSLAASTPAAVAVPSIQPSGLTSSADGERVYELPLDLLDPSPDQPRLNVEPDPEFLENIRLKGVRTPIHVRPAGEGRYHIVSGERRWRASQILGKRTIPVLIREDSSASAAAEALLDNLLRKELTGYEEAKGYQKLIEQHQYQKSELAQRLGCDKGRITRALQVLELPQSILELTLGAGSPLTLTHVQELLPLRSNLVKLQRVAKQAIDEGWSAHRIREEVTRVPRINQGAQSVRFSSKGGNGPFTLIIKFHPNRAKDIVEIEERIAEVQSRLKRFKQQV